MIPRKDAVLFLVLTSAIPGLGRGSQKSRALLVVRLPWGRRARDRGYMAVFAATRSSVCLHHVCVFSWSLPERPCMAAQQCGHSALWHC